MIFHENHVLSYPIFVENWGNVTKFVVKSTQMDNYAIFSKIYILLGALNVRV